MRKLFAFLTAMVMLLGCAFAETTAAPEAKAWPGAITGPLTEKAFSWYCTEKNNLIDDEASLLRLWFAEDAQDLPFMDLPTWAELMVLLVTDNGRRPGYTLTSKIDEQTRTVTLTRDNGFDAVFDFSEGTITFSDYLAFLQLPNSVYLGTNGFTGLAPDSEPFLLTVTGSRNRYGEVTTLRLKDYGIPMIVQDGKYLLPLQTLSSSCRPVWPRIS